MHPLSTVQAAIQLGERGLNATEVGRKLGVPRGTVRDWLAGRVPSVATRSPDACDQCGHVHRFDLVTESYVYILGLYLGDGCISSHRRGVYRLRITLDLKYPEIIRSAASAMAEVRDGKSAVQRRQSERCVEVYSYWKAWPCLLPQHGLGKKHERAIVLTSWQLELVERWPEQLLRGLIHSDGHRFINTGRCGWVCPRYWFSQVSEDIRGIFCHACDLLGLRWTRSGERTIYVSRKADVAKLDEFIGPNR
jgi:hypothetical protein